jgi:frataxin-like iron-binding protein CyaY
MVQVRQIETVLDSLSNEVQTYDFDAIGGVMDVSFKNTGAADVVLTFRGGNKFVLASGDPMLSLGGYWNCLRRDIVKVAALGTNCQVFYTKSVGACDQVL